MEKGVLPFCDKRAICRLALMVLSAALCPTSPIDPLTVLIIPQKIYAERSRQRCPHTFMDIRKLQTQLQRRLR
jgi:hypothetical protein